MFIALNGKKLYIQCFMEMINEPRWTQNKAGLYTTWGTEFYCVCVANVFFCTWCMCTRSSCPSCVHTHRSAYSCCYRLQSRMMKTLSSGILLTSHSHIQLQQAKVGESDTHAHATISFTLTSGIGVVGSVGRADAKHLPPESSSRRLQKLEYLGYVASSGFEVLTKPCPAPRERAASSGTSLCSNLGLTPSRWQTRFTLRCPRCWSISQVASVRFFFFSCSQSPAYLNCPPLLLWHCNPLWFLFFSCSWPQILPSLCSVLKSTIFLPFLAGH